MAQQDLPSVEELTDDDKLALIDILELDDIHNLNASQVNFNYNNNNDTKENSDDDGAIQPTTIEEVVKQELFDAFVKESTEDEGITPLKVKHPKNICTYLSNI